MKLLKDKQGTQVVPGFSTYLGVIIGGLIGFLLRPSAFLVGQLPFTVVITRGANLKGLDSLLVPIAQRSFNYLLIGVILGGIAGFILPLLIHKKEQESGQSSK